MILLLVIFGLIIGSFLNAVIYRSKFGGNLVTQRSHCVNCGRTIKSYDLVPLLSFLWLRGRCRFCRKKISWQYPLVEAATALVFVFGWFLFGKSLSFEYLVFLFFSCILLIIFVIDLRYYLILDRITLPAIVLALIVNLYQGHSLYSLLGAGLAVGGFFALQFALSKGKWIGGGDIRMGVLMGVLLGWPLALAALFLAYILGAFTGIVLMLVKKKGWQSQLPFGTFLSLGTFLAWIYGQELSAWYFNLYF